MIGFTNFQNTLSLFKTLFYLNEENEIIDSQFNIVVFMKHTLLRGFEFRQLLLHTHDNTRTPKAPAVGQSIDWLPIIANKPHNSIRVNLSPLAYLYKKNTLRSQMVGRSPNDVWMNRSILPNFPKAELCWLSYQKEVHSQRQWLSQWIPVSAFHCSVDLFNEVWHQYSFVKWSSTNWTELERTWTNFLRPN